MGHDNTATHIQNDTTSPVASQLQLRLFLAVSAFRKYDIVQLDLTNAYLHAPILDVVYIYVPEGFPGQGEIAHSITQSSIWHETRSTQVLRLHGNSFETHWNETMPHRTLPLSLPSQ
jgi:hypothetical protein